MRIKIDRKNADAITAELAKCNGRASAHTFNSAEDILFLASTAEANLERLLTAKKLYAGARLHALSGGSVSRAYAKKGFSGRKATQVVLERGTTAWYLVYVCTSSIRENGGYTTTRLTPEQDANAITKLRTRYDVAAHNYWVSPSGAMTSWGVFTDEVSAKAAFSLVSGQTT